VQFNYLPTVRARLALDRGNASEALEILAAAVPNELGLTTFSGDYAWNGLYPVFVRGEAYLAAHQGNSAAAEFQKILDHRGIVWNSPIGALAHLQLGRAYAMTGDTAKARAAYQDFLLFGKTPTPTSPSSSKPNPNSPNCTSLGCILPSHQDSSFLAARERGRKQVMEQVLSSLSVDNPCQRAVSHPGEGLSPSY